MGFLKGGDFLLVVREWVNSFGWIWRAKGLGGIQSEKKFEVILELERARAERSGGEFSLVVFRVSRKADEAILLAEILARRIRATDVVGWFREQMSVLLPDTPASGAWKLAEDIRQKMTAASAPTACTVYSYPFQGQEDENDGLRSAPMIDSCLK